MICKMRGIGNNYKNIFLNYLLQINKKFYQLTSSEDQAMIVLEGKEKPNWWLLTTCDFSCKIV